MGRKKRLKFFHTIRKIRKCSLTWQKKQNININTKIRQADRLGFAQGDKNATKQAVKDKIITNGGNSNGKITSQTDTTSTTNLSCKKVSEHNEDNEAGREVYIWRMNKQVCNQTNKHEDRQNRKPQTELAISRKSCKQTNS